MMNDGGGSRSSLVGEQMVRLGSVVYIDDDEEDDEEGNVCSACTLGRCGVRAWRVQNSGERMNNPPHPFGYLNCCGDSHAWRAHTHTYTHKRARVRFFFRFFWGPYEHLAAFCTRFECGVHYDAHL